MEVRFINHVWGNDCGPVMGRSTPVTVEAAAATAQQSTRSVNFLSIGTKR